MSPLPLAIPFVEVDRLPPEGRRAAMIDLRAPVEFAEDHAPGAINVPLFEDDTRAYVGLLYRQFGPEAAFQEGRAAVVDGVETLVNNILAAIGRPAPAEDLRARVLELTSEGMARMEGALELCPAPELSEDAVVFTCARGGLRSRSVVALMRSIGLDAAVGLEGGYRAYRRSVMERLGEWQPPGLVVSLRGLTGVGKTLVLRAIEELRPGWTLDLEGIAGHRSSLLGMVGLAPVSQKAFESGLLRRVERGFPAGVMVVEGESRKVGDAVIPSTLWSAMGSATNIEITAQTSRRVTVLAEDYLAEPAALPVLRQQLETVSKRMQGEPDLPGMLDRREIGPLVELLLERYYDPLYRRSESGKVYAAKVDAENAEEAAAEVVRWIESEAQRPRE
ncbi:MAG: tRNA 2-selenouridine(34) synthase MnmH [Planctomycetota bacterium]|nr:tRNA 2-selenouridine(34) synthase MnmH [Planctomycetota bacterium]MDG1986168.1 tRNA 2-selenouridine(34) synthase MnmH [Planctomycetota bacterium]